MNADRRIRRIAIVGGATAGWMAAVMLARRLGGQCSIHVVDGDGTPAPGIADATLPGVLELLRFLGIEQNDFVDKTQSTYCLGRRISDWAEPGQAFWHPFGAFGTLVERRPFYHFWHKARAQGMKPRSEFFNLETAMSMAGKFIFPTNSIGVAQNMRYALHVDTALAARYLRSLAERAGVIRLERKLVSTVRREDGFIEELKFEDGGSLRADLFIDCSQDGRLIGTELGVPWIDYRQWLPCDRLLAIPVALEETRPPYVRIQARAAGWQWRMPLQQHTSAGQVYSSALQTPEAALQELTEAAGAPLLEPLHVEIAAGRRAKTWEHNVVALGSAAGFLEPLLGIDRHAVTHGLLTLLEHFPDRDFHASVVNGFNAAIAEEFDHHRDFLLLHYHLSRREEPFWQQRRAEPLPDSLAQRVELYRASGRIQMQRPETFTDLDWFWIFEGMGVVPRDYDPLIDCVDFEQVKRLMLAISQKVSSDVAAAPTHDSFFLAANARLAGARKAAAAATAATAPSAESTPG